MEQALDRIRSIRDQLRTRGPDVQREAGDFRCVALPADDADVLRDLLIAERPTSVVEIGLAYGSSALAIAEALIATAADQQQHLIIDAYQHSAFGGVGWDHLMTAGLEDTCQLIEEPSQHALPRLAAAGTVVDAAFVDGSHHFHNVFVDLYYLAQLVRPEGLIVLDDCDYPSVRTAAAYYELNLDWSPEPIDRTTRLRAYRLPAQRPSYDFTRFLLPSVDQQQNG